MAPPGARPQERPPWPDSAIRGRAIGFLQPTSAHQKPQFLCRLRARDHLRSPQIGYIIFRRITAYNAWSVVNSTIVADKDRDAIGAVASCRGGRSHTISSSRSGLSAGYHRPLNGGAGTWWGRARTDGRYRVEAIPGFADDHQDADGERISKLGSGASRCPGVGRQGRPEAGPYTVADGRSATMWPICAPGGATPRRTMLTPA